MEDYIKREIDKIGKRLAAILQKIGVLKETKSDDLVNVAKLELVEGLNLDIEELLQKEEFIEILIQEYHFNNDNLEKFGDLIFDFIETTDDINERQNLIRCIINIYKYLDENSNTISFHRHYILKELKKYL